MAVYFWDVMFAYPLESSIIISVVTLAYVGWLKKFWYLHRPSIYTAKIGEWRVRRYVGRIVSFETEKGMQKLTKKYAELNQEQVVVLIYISGQPIRRMILNNKNLYNVQRVPKKLFKKVYTFNKKNIKWASHLNAYVMTDKPIENYLLKPEIFEKAMMKKIDNIDIKASRGSRVAPQLIHSGYFNQHLPIPPDEYSEKDRQLEVTNYAYQRKDQGGYGAYDSVLQEEKDDDKKEKDDDEVGSDEKHGRA